MTPSHAVRSSNVLGLSLFSCSLIGNFGRKSSTACYCTTHRHDGQASTTKRHCWQLETSIYISTTTVSHLVSDAPQQCDSPAWVRYRNSTLSQKAPMGNICKVDTIYWETFKFVYTQIKFVFHLVETNYYKYRKDQTFYAAPRALQILQYIIS